jgi:hypothetical protein
MQDILINSSGDLVIENGDFKVADPTSQNQQLIIASQKGEWKQNPLTGVGIADWLKGEKQGGLKAEIKQQLKGDGMKVNKIEINQHTISIDAIY